MGHIENHSALETDSSHAGAPSSGESIPVAAISNKDWSDINPFKGPEGLEWVDDLVRAGFGRTDVPQQRVPKSTLKAKTVCLADVQPELIHWLWPGRIALGKLTLISGDPGLGKSLLTSFLAAVVSKGYTWPLSKAQAHVGSVVLLSAEDDAADTIRPRLDAAEADCTRVHIVQAVIGADKEGPVQRSFSLKRDAAVLEELLLSIPDCRLLVIDPISAYLGENTDSHKNSDVRGLLAPLSEIAARYGVAVVLVDHLNKNGMGSAMYRSMGSIAFVAAARAAYIVTKDKDNQERRLVMPIKNNLAKDTTGLAYSIITAENGAPVVAWESEPVMITADEALAPFESDEDKTSADWAVMVLQDVLKDGPVLASVAIKEAKQAGLTDKTLRTAREKLGIKPVKAAFRGGWLWSLPGHEDALDTEGAPPQNEDILGAGGHLGGETASEV